MLSCRCCLVNSAELIDLSSTMTVSNGNIFMSNDKVLTIGECLQICTDIHFEDENHTLPQTICLECYCELKVSFEFRAKCENSDLILRNRIKLTCVDRNGPDGPDESFEQSINEMQIGNVAGSERDERINEDSTLIIEVLDDFSMVGKIEEKDLEFTKDMRNKNRERLQSNSSYTALVQMKHKSEKNTTRQVTNLNDQRNKTIFCPKPRENSPETNNASLMIDHYTIKQTHLDNSFISSTIKQKNIENLQSHFECEICGKISSLFKFRLIYKQCFINLNYFQGIKLILKSIWILFTVAKIYIHYVIFVEKCFLSYHSKVTY